MGTINGRNSQPVMSNPVTPVLSTPLQFIAAFGDNICATASNSNAGDLTVTGSDPGDLTLQSCTNAQSYTLSTSTSQLTNTANPSMCLAPIGNYPGAEIKQTRCDDNPIQKWTYEALSFPSNPTNSTQYKFRHNSSSYYINAWGGYPNINTPMKLGYYSDQRNDQFLQPALSA